jgi:hypothetical protein
MNFNGYFMEFLTGLTERLLVPVFLLDIEPYYPMNYDWQAIDFTAIIPYNRETGYKLRFFLC